MFNNMKYYHYSKPSSSINIDGVKNKKLWPTPKIIFPEHDAGVYLINCVDGKLYVGSTKFLSNRINQHRNMNRHICNNSDQFKIDDFSYKILEYLHKLETEDDKTFKSRIADSERYWQDHYDVLSENAHNLEKVAGLNKSKEYRPEIIELRQLKGRSGQHDRTKEAKAKHSKSLSKSLGNKITIDNVEFESINAASKHYKVSKNVISDKLDSSNFPTYIRLQPKRKRLN